MISFSDSKNMLLFKKVENMEIYENTALMWLERTQRAELVDLEVEADENLEVEARQDKKLVHLEVVGDNEKSVEVQNMEVEVGQVEEEDVENKKGVEEEEKGVEEGTEEEVEEVEKDFNKKSGDKELVSKGLDKQQSGAMVLSLEVQCAIGKVRVMINEAKEDLEVAIRRGNFVEAKTFQDQVRLDYDDVV